MKVLDFSKHDDYHTQRNNIRDPHGTCLATSLVMAAKQAGWALDRVPDGVQPEDELANLCHSTEARELIEDHYSWALDTDGNMAYPRHTIHGVARWALNVMLEREGGSSPASFSTDMTPNHLLSLLGKRYGIALSGSFDLPNGETLNHVVSLAGVSVKDGQDMESILWEGVIDFIIDDPYGDYHTSYRDVHGNNTRISKSEFLGLFKPIGKREKWAHVVSPKESE